MLVFCLLLLPVKVADISLRYGACFLIMEATFKWIKHCPKTHGQTYVEPSTDTIWLERLGPVWTSTYKLCRYILNEKDSDFSVYVKMLCGLVCFNLMIMTVRLIGEHVRMRDIWLVLSFYLEIVVHITFNNTQILKVFDTNIEIILIMVAQCINSLFYFRVFRINGYFQCVSLSYFLLIDVQRVSYFVILPILYVLGLLISLQKHLSAIISHLEHLDLKKIYQHHHRKTLESCFFYVVINLLLRGIEPENLQFTVAIYCALCAGIWWYNKQADWNSDGRIFFKRTETSRREISRKNMQDWGPETQAHIQDLQPIDSFRDLR